jgi:hypothetical protein
VRVGTDQRKDQLEARSTARRERSRDQMSTLRLLNFEHRKAQREVKGERTYSKMRAIEPRMQKMMAKMS